MQELTVVRWTRFGKDRFYVKDINGLDLGWMDAATGDVTSTDPATIPDIVEAVRAHREGAAPHSRSVQAVTDAPMPPELQPEHSSAEPLAPDVAGEHWDDLAANRPGQAARTRAEEELAAMKERSRIGTWVARTFDAKTDERAWRIGAGGEETVGGRLEKLTKHGWYVLHAVPVGTGDSDIDHALIGPGGVFTLNTKTHPGKKIWVGGRSVMVSGHKVPYIRNSEFEADRATRLLTEAAGFPVFATPVLVFLTGSLIPDVTVKSAPERVLILDRMDLPGAFKRRSGILSPEQADAVFEVARRSTTWKT